MGENVELSNLPELDLSSVFPYLRFSTQEFDPSNGDFLKNAERASVLLGALHAFQVICARFNNLTTGLPTDDLESRLQRIEEDKRTAQDLFNKMMVLTDDNSSPENINGALVTVQEIVLNEKSLGDNEVLPTVLQIDNPRDISVAIKKFRRIVNHGLRNKIAAFQISDPINKGYAQTKAEGSEDIDFVYHSLDDLVTLVIPSDLSEKYPDPERVGTTSEDLVRLFKQNFLNLVPHNIKLKSPPPDWDILSGLEVLYPREFLEELACDMAQNEIRAYQLGLGPESKKMVNLIFYTSKESSGGYFIVESTNNACIPIPEDILKSGPADGRSGFRDLGFVGSTGSAWAYHAQVLARYGARVSFKNRLSRKKGEIGGLGILGVRIKVVFRLAKRENDL